MKPCVLLTFVALVSVGCAHSQRPRAPVYIVADSTEGLGTAPGTGGAGARDCQAEHEECFRDCWQNRRPPYPHKHDEWYYKHCTTVCREAFVACEEEQERTNREGPALPRFSEVDQAIAWILDHKSEVALGTVIIIAGGAFVLSISGAGALVLVPLAL